VKKKESLPTKIVIEAGNSGDPSVGIAGTEVKITIETNCNVEDIMKDIHYRDNDKLFHADIQNILAWIDDSTCTIDEIRME